LSTLNRPLVAALAGFKLVLHLLLANRYGYFRDEMYFLDCGRHLDFGYVDHAPLIAVVSRAALELGGSLLALRVFPALAGAVLVALAMAIAWRLGGGSFAQAVAGVAVIAAPVYLAVHGLLSMNAFEPLFWMGAVYVLVRIIQTGEGRRWMVFGLLLGLGLENKHSTAFFGIAVAMALVASPERQALRTRWPWLAAALAVALFLPNLVWQAQHAFPTLEGLANVRRTGKNVVLGPAEFVAQQVLMMHPVLLPIWLGGLAWLFAGVRGRYRMLGWIFVAFFALLFVLKGKNYYLAPIYPLLMAAGGVALESALQRARLTRDRAWPRAAVLALIVAAAAMTAPMALPVLAPERYVAYEQAIGFAPPKTEVGHRGPLPQHFGDRFGWPELVAEVARIYHALPADDRARAAIFANNYGEAGAINLFGPRYGLPPAVSAHQNHFLWGPRGNTGEVLIVLQDDRESLEKICGSVEEAGVHFHPWGMAEENNPIFVCRGLTPPLPVMWPRLKKWN
jgi:4-amino-4-deoxy-L-arabinose transferase-like glycosyltransferase